MSSMATRSFPDFGERTVKPCARQSPEPGTMMLNISGISHRMRFLFAHESAPPMPMGSSSAAFLAYHASIAAALAFAIASRAPLSAHGFFLASKPKNLRNSGSVFFERQRTPQ